MKKPIQKNSKEAIEKAFPIIGKVSGWYFRKKEISNGGWQVEGTDLWGRRVSKIGDDPEKLLLECNEEAENINKQINQT